MAKQIRFDIKLNVDGKEVVGAAVSALTAYFLKEFKPSDGLELTACYSGLLEYRLAVEAALAGLWC